MGQAIIASGHTAQAICDRCRMTYPYTYLRPDGQSPGLQVCRDCWDHLTPYAQPPLQPDAFVLRRPRPMVHLVAYKYQNIPIYEGGPVSVGPEDDYVPPYPFLEPPEYPPNYIPFDLDANGGFDETPPQVFEEIIPPPFPPED